MTSPIEPYEGGWRSVGCNRAERQARKQHRSDVEREACDRDSADGVADHDRGKQGQQRRAFEECADSIQHACLHVEDTENVAWCGERLLRAGRTRSAGAAYAACGIVST